MIRGLPSGVRSAVYSRLVDQLLTDPVLSSVVKTWTHGIKARGGTTVLPNAGTATHVRLLPRLGPADWYSPDAQLGDLVVGVELLAAGSAVGLPDAIDSLDLWEAVENAFYPVGDPNRRLAVEQALRDAGSHTGQVVFSRPASIAGTDQESGRPILVGEFRVDVVRPLNP